MQRSQLEAIVQFAQHKFGHGDVMINNAGIIPLSAPDQRKMNEWDQMIHVNIRGVLYNVAAALSIMKAQRQVSSLISLRSTGTPYIPLRQFTVRLNLRLVQSQKD